MSSVWFEEVDKGLIAEIHKSVKYKESKTSIVQLPEKNIVIRRPEEDFSIEVFPCVSIYNLSDKYDVKRHFPFAIPVGVSEDNTKVIMEKTAVPYQLSYQLDFWSQYQDDMNLMTRTWKEEHFRQFNLDVIDDASIERSCNCMQSSNAIKSDLISNGKRMFHTIFSYNIWVEIDSEIRYNVNMVKQVDIDVPENE